MIQAMNLKQLKRICRQGENQHVEFKQNLNHPEQVIEEVVGFANASGGSLYIGITDRGEPLGLRHAEADLAFIREHLAERILPVPVFTAGLIEIDEQRAVIRIEVPEGNRKPYGYVPAGAEVRRVLYRVDDHCLQASRELKNIMRGRQRQVLAYTDLEKAVLQAARALGPAGKRQLAEQAGYPARQVSECLVRLVIAGVMQIHPARGGDTFSIKEAD